MASRLEPVHARGEDNAPHSLEYNEESQEGMPSRVFDVDVRNETIALPAGPASLASLSQNCQAVVSSTNLEQRVAEVFTFMMAMSVIWHVSQMLDKQHVDKLDEHDKTGDTGADKPDRAGRYGETNSINADLVEQYLHARSQRNGCRFGSTHILDSSSSNSDHYFGAAQILENSSDNVHCFAIANMLKSSADSEHCSSIRISEQIPPEFYSGRIYEFCERI